ncbi:MAG: hypothetical protein KC613_07840, partial [Myxococcales bacterium]|nr:hypothetical protein [Myxococcales bacterium]
MLIDLHANPGDLDPQAFAKRVYDAGLGGAVVARTHVAGDLTPWLSALEDLDLAGFAGVTLELEKGRLVFLPDDWEGEFAETDWTPPEGNVWTWEDAKAKADAIGGALFASHPYDRSSAAPADAIYKFKDVDGVAVRSMAERSGWDRLAEAAARTLGAAFIGSSGGDPARIGVAGTVVDDEIMTEPELVQAIKDGLTFVIEFEPTDNRKDRDPPRP